MPEEQEEPVTNQERADWGNEFLCAERKIAKLESRIQELEADYAKLINHTDPDYVIGLQHRIKELEEKEKARRAFISACEEEG